MPFFIVSFSNCSFFEFPHLDSKQRDSMFAKWHRVSVVQPPVLARAHEKTSDLEMLPAYLPYLQAPATKITIRGPVLFPVLQNLVDTCTNHEFVVDERAYSSNNLTSFDDLTPECLQEIEDDDEDVMFIQQSDSTEKPHSLLVKTNETSAIKEVVTAEVELMADMFDVQILETIDHLLQQVELQVKDQLDLLPTVDLPYDEVSQCVSDLLDSVVEDKAPSAGPHKKTSPARPTTLDLLRGRSYDQSARNENELGFAQLENIRKISRTALSIFVNRCSNQDQEDQEGNMLIASTLVSPDTPRAKRKYQQLHINGNAYTNLGLKVTTRPTYCCIFRAQPMFVTQDSNPQLSMYSQWKNHPIPPGDVLQLLRTPHELMSAYNSQEAVLAVSRCRLTLVEVATAATMGGIDLDPETAEDGGADIVPDFLNTDKPTGIVTREFLDRVSSRLTNYMSTNVLRSLSLDESSRLPGPFPARSFERTLRAVVISVGEGFCTRLADSATTPQFILTHSSHHRLSQLSRNSTAIANRIRKRSRTHNVDYYKGVTPATTCTMGIASTSACTSSTAIPISPYLSQSEQASRLSISESSLKLPELSNWMKPRKRSSQTSQMSATSLSSSNFSPFLTMHPMLGHLPAKSKQTVMYIMMMGQAPMSMAVPTVPSMTCSKNLASRKFSECIGMKAPSNVTSIEEHNWAARIAADGSTEIVPKRIKIFEGKCSADTFSHTEETN